MTNIIGLHGPAGAGKTTIAMNLCWRLEKASKISFATPMKNMMVAYLESVGCPHNEIGKLMNDPKIKEEPTDWLAGKSPRHAMQTLGTQWGRHQMDDNFWVTSAFNKIAVTNFNHIIIDDVRFENEIEAIQRYGGRVISLKRPGVEFAGNHASAMDMTERFNLDVVMNDGTKTEVANYIVERFDYETITHHR